MTSQLNTKFDEYLDFPCQFPFKILGLADDRLPDMIMAVLQEYAPGDYSPKVRPSSKGTYHSVSVAVTVTSKEHVEQLYLKLGEIELVKYVL